MTRQETREKILINKVVAVVRTKSPDQLPDIISALLEGGVLGIELTMTIPRAIESIEKAAKEFGNKILLGVGSVTKKEDAIKAINAGATFVVSPVYKQEIVDVVIKENRVIIPAGFTPTEIQNAYENGADFIKIFPADILGMSFIKSIKAPLPHLNVIPTGGVNLDNAIDWIKHGASAVGIGSALVDKKAIEHEDYSKLTENAKKLCLNLGLNEEK